MTIEGQKTLKYLILLLFISALSLAWSPIVLAEASWIDSPEEITLQHVRDLAPGEALPYRINGNIDCQEEKIITRPEKILLIWPFYQSEKSTTGCVVITSFGSYYGALGMLRLHDTSLYGTLKNSGGGSAKVIPIHKSDAVLVNTGSAPHGAYYSILPNFISTLTAEINSSWEVTFKTDTSNARPIQDRSGKKLMGVYDTISYSPNGKWIVMDSVNIGMLRINTESGEVLPFGPILRYDIGTTPEFDTAISGNGRFAAMTSRYGTRRIYDLNTCTPAPDIINGPVDCEWLDLNDILRTHINGFSGMSSMKFRTNEVLNFYASRRDEAGSVIRGEYFLRIDDSNSSNFEYLALGDSFASGEGAYLYKAGTDTDNNKCHLSHRSYPYLLGSALSLNTVESVACSGASISDVLSVANEKTQAKGMEALEFDASILANFYPGHRSQLLFIQEYKPRIVTVSAIGNDIGFSDKIKRCLEPDTCYETYEDRLEIIYEVNSQFSRLVDMYRQLIAESPPETRIYVVGYPQIADPEGSCGLNVRLNKAELYFANELVSYLNSLISQAAKKAGVGYADIEQAFVGHRFCETASHLIAINGLTRGNDIIEALGGPIGNESYHPNGRGHELMSQAILTATDHFTMPMPHPDPTANLPSHDGIALLNAPVTGRALNRLNYNTETQDNVVYRGGAWNTTITGLKSSISPRSTYSVWINSDPVHLGDFVSDDSGTLEINTTIPESMPTGFHTLHIYGPNITGESIDLYKTIYIAASPTDLDGDGMPDDGSPCLIFPASGSDMDQDGIDDACDDLIDLPPPAEEPPAEDPPVSPPGKKPKQIPFCLPPDHANKHARTHFPPWRRSIPHPLTNCPRSDRQKLHNHSHSLHAILIGLFQILVNNHQELLSRYR